MYANETLTNLILLANNEYLNISEFNTARVCLEHYQDLLCLGHKKFLEETLIPASAFKKLLKLMNISNYADFKNSIQLFVNTRYKQIEERYIKTSINQLEEKIKNITNKQSMINLDTINRLMYRINESQRIIIFTRKELCGSFIDFQLDMLLMGKVVLVYPTQIETNIQIKENDLVIFFSLTGRNINYFQNIYKSIQGSHCYSVIVTMSEKIGQYYNDMIYIEADTDDFECNYSIKLYFDYLRYSYYQKVWKQNVVE